ncbi:MAG: pyridoxal phosphate-dependent aminotransferase [Kineosporiaceae bacterium]
MTAPGVRAPMLDLSSGQVLDPLAPPLRSAALATAGAGPSPYAPRGGQPELRRAVAELHAARTGRAAGAEQVVVTPGVRTALFTAAAVVARGRDVLVPAPHWSHYPRTLDLAGARMVPVPGDPADRRRVDVATLEAARTTTTTTAAVLLTSPVNPSGAVLDRDRVRAIACWAAAAGLTVLVDDVYGAFAGAEDPLGATGPRTVVVGGVSKVHALAGLRVGWVVGPPDLSAELDDVAEHVAGPVGTAAQSVAVAALAEPFRSRDVAGRVRRSAVALADATRLFRSVPGVDVVPADAGIYLCLSVARLLDARAFGAADDRALCAALADRTGVRMRAGSTFGMPAHLRLCVAAPPGVLAAAAERLRTHLHKFAG